MTTIDFQKIRDEVCVMLRSNDVLSTTVRGVTRTASTYTVGVGGEATHTFTGNIPVRDFHSLTVNGTAKYYLRDYTMNWDTGVITWNSALINNDVVVYSIDWGTSDKIFPDMPRDDLTLNSFPRIGIELTSVSTEPLGLGGQNHITDILMTTIVWVPVNKNSAVVNFGGLQDLESTMNLIRSVMRTNAKSFYTFKWVYPKSQGPLIKSVNGKIMQRSADYLIRFIVE